MLDLALTLAALRSATWSAWPRARPRRCSAADRAAALAGAPAARDARRLREAAERCEDARQSLELNVTEELAL